MGSGVPVRDAVLSVTVPSTASSSSWEHRLNSSSESAMQGPSDGCCFSSLPPCWHCGVRWAAPCLRRQLCAPCPWLLNAGARFLIPSVIFGAFALGLVVQSLPKRVRLPAAALVLAAQCLTSWPALRGLWYYADLWTVEGFPWRAALRLEPQKWHLARNVEFFLLADRLDQIADSNTRVLSFFNLPEAYFQAELLVYYQGLENQESRRRPPGLRRHCEASRPACGGPCGRSGQCRASGSGRRGRMVQEPGPCPNCGCCETEA